ncbi:Cthe_2314 family HEPN domain-containing protein [Paraburkholderia solisilvae]|uniref:Cthe-2314-like HEPN domain-containing protein n=1 Tax=Paraburkholderia solisilvae TaxID=624376 RepID=A0A6J5F1K4_9BURK|nr:Cthe_2314 family HEPN domain-containing protein [Paraburkholderia solisilvae]CAB3771185.1 hypothetical protein LMG29739_05978 [Paraburkholderia solisilvae]
MTRSDDLLYNVENYLIRIVSVYDGCLQLTNAVFHLCISDEMVGHGVIVKNLHVARTGVPRRLKMVKKVIKSEERERHAIIHRHSHMDPESERIERLYMHTKETWAANRKHPYSRLINARAHMVKAYTAKRRKEFGTINAGLVDALGPLFDDLLSEYRRQKGRLQKIV